MNSTFSSPSFIRLFERVWISLDDIFVCIAVILAVFQLTNLLHRTMRHYFRLPAYIAQCFHFVLLFIAVIFVIGHLVGDSTAISLFSGLSIGFGYALQPYIVSLMAGATFVSMGIMTRGDTLTINGNTVVIDHVGLLYVSAKQGPKTTYFPNSLLSASPFTVGRPVSL